MERESFSYRDFQPLLSEALCQELEKAEEDTTRSTVRYRVLKRLADLLDVDLPIPKGKIRIDPHRARELVSLGRGFPKRLLAKDLHATNEMIRFLKDYFDDGSGGREWKRHQPDEEEGEDPIYRIFAVDGTMGYDPIAYVDRLSDGRRGPKQLYVSAVRQLYNNRVGISKEEVHGIVESFAANGGSSSTNPLREILGEKDAERVRCWMKECATAKKKGKKRKSCTTTKTGEP